MQVQSSVLWGSTERSRSSWGLVFPPFAEVCISTESNVAQTKDVAQEDIVYAVVHGGEQVGEFEAKSHCDISYSIAPSWNLPSRLLKIGLRALEARLIALWTLSEVRRSSDSFLPARVHKVQSKSAESGFSVHASQDMPADTTVATCPFQLVISPDSSRSALNELLPTASLDELKGWSGRQLIVTYVSLHSILELDHEFALERFFL